MFSNIFPSNPCIELYSASSNDILKLWKMKGKIIKEFEPLCKSYIHILLLGGTSIMSLPNQENQFLQIKNSFLLFQFVLLNQKGIYIELNARDINNNMKKMKIPINNYPLNLWTNLLIDVGSIFRQVYQNNLKYIDSILITGNIKIRKIYSLKSKDEILPKSFDLGKYINIQSYLLFDYNLSYIKINFKINEYSNKKENVTPIKKGRQISPLRMENKNNNIFSINEKTKKNIEFAKKIPDLTRVKNEINYGLKISPNGICSIRNINRILGYNIIENLETYNEIKTPIKNNYKKRDNSSRKMQKSPENKYYIREMIMQRPNNKSTNPKKRNKYTKYESKYFITNETMNAKNNNNLNNENNNNQQYDIDNVINNINNINRIAFHNDTLYNLGGKINKEGQLKYMSYGINIQQNSNKKENNLKINNESKLPKKEKNNLELPLIKSNITQQNISNIENNNKYGNFEIMLDSALLNNSKVQAQLYDSIEEESCLVNNNINSTLIEGSKMEDKIIKIDPVKNKGKLWDHKDSKKDLNATNTDILPEISNLIHDDSNYSNRPYTPPLAKLVPLNQSRNIKQKNILGDEKNEQIINKKNPNNISYVKNIKNSDNLLYDEIKGCYYDPKTNIYYDIKNLL